MQAHNVATATTAELLAFFNANTGGAQVKKFADRKTAERRVLALIAEIAEEQAETAAPEVAEPVVAETPIVDKFIPSYNHTVCPKCGSSEIYNGRADNGIVVGEDEIAGCHTCDWVQDDRKAQKPAVSTGKARPAMAESLKLDRRITHVETGTVYENACRVWKAGLVSASQGDRLSATLYSAAKKGDYVSLTVNGHTFTLTAR